MTIKLSELDALCVAPENNIGLGKQARDARNALPELLSWIRDAREVFRCASFIGKGSEGCESCATSSEELLSRIEVD